MGCTATAKLDGNVVPAGVAANDNAVPGGRVAWYRNYHRYYDPASGRYTQVDPLLVDRAATAVHPYAYALSNPLSFIDPSGLLVELWCEQLRGIKHCYVRSKCDNMCPSFDKTYEMGVGMSGTNVYGLTLSWPFESQKKYRQKPQVIDSWSSPDCSLENCIDKTYKRRTSRRLLPYSPMGPNCNTFASDLLSSCGIYTFFPEDAYGAPQGVFSPTCQ
jgi:RHS repeat-associated protein